MTEKRSPNGYRLCKKCGKEINKENYGFSGICFAAHRGYHCDCYHQDDDKRLMERLKE